MPFITQSRFKLSVIPLVVLLSSSWTKKLLFYKAVELIVYNRM